MRYAADEIRPQYRGLWQTVLTIVILMIPVYFFDRMTGENYMFLNEASEGSPLVILWNIFGTRFGEAGYLLSYVALGMAVFHVLYLVYTAIAAATGRRSRKKYPSRLFI